MILLLDTSTPVCKVSLVEADWRYDTSWEANRDLANGLLGFLQAEVEAQGKKLRDLTGVVVFRGPGSFTGLRIGITVANTLAYADGFPIVGETGETWQEKGIARLLSGDNDEIVLPEYGGEANITTPRK